MKISTSALRPFLMIALAVASTAASAQFAPRVASEEIEGAIMPAIPFPLKGDTTAASEAPKSMGLAPTPSVESSQREPVPAPRLAPRPIMSAQDLADRLLNR